LELPIPVNTAERRGLLSRKYTGQISPVSICEKWATGFGLFRVIRVIRSLIIIGD